MLIIVAKAGRDIIGEESNGGAWLAESVEHATLNLGVLSSNPRLGVITLKKF